MSGNPENQPAENNNQQQGLVPDNPEAGLNNQQKRQQPEIQQVGDDDQQEGQQLENNRAAANVIPLAEIPYSSDEDLNEFRDKDATASIVAYVDEVHAPIVVGRKAKYDLLKFTLNNNSNKRVICLVWGKALIDKYMNEIKICRILSIEGAKTKAMLMNFFKEAKNYIPFELLIQPNTTIDYIGQHQAHVDVPLDRAPREVMTFENVGRARGFISITGFIKMKFARFETLNNEVYGCGSITNGTLKVTVHIKNYPTALELEKGTSVTVVGEIKDSVIIECRDADSIIVNQDVAPMSVLDLARGVRNPKRRLEE